MKLEDLSAQVMVFDLVLITVLRALGREHPATARAIVRGLQDQQARLVQESPQAQRAHTLLQKYQHALQELLAEKPQ